MIKLESITKTFDNNFRALNGISLEINKGDFLAITGKSGSGKSTLLNIIGLLNEQTEGKYYLDGKDISKYRDKEKAKLRSDTFGYVFQEYFLDLDLTVYQNLEIPFIIKKAKKKDYDLLIKDTLKMLNINEKEKVKTKKLSGGEKQRVSIARALLNNPIILLADEPTGALDSTNSKIVLDFLKEINAKGITVILVTHNLDEASYANKIITLKDGEIIDQKD